MNRKPLLALSVLLVLLVVTVAYLLTSGEGGRKEASARDEARGRAPAAASVAAEELAKPAGIAADEGAARVEAPARTPATAGGVSLDPEDARWVDVNVVLPTGVPVDDRIELLAFSAQPGESWSQQEAARLGRDVDLSSESLEELDDDLRWSRHGVTGGGVVRVPFHPDSTQGALLVVARYVYAPTRVVELASERAVTLEAELGAWVTGRIVLPKGIEDRDVQPDDLELDFEGRGKGGLFAGSSDSRDVRIAGDLTFELRALSAEQKYAVHVQAERLVDFFDLRFSAEPGEHRVYDIPLSAGSVVSGHVLTQRRELVAGASVEANLRGGGLMQMIGSGSESVETDDDGVFTLYGLAAGKLTLAAQADGYLDAEGPELEVKDGQRLDGYEIVLDPGNEIAGRVEWTDGSAARHALVVASTRERQGWRNEIARDQTDENGAFVLSGLGEGPYELRAELEAAGAEEERPAAPVRTAMLDRRGDLGALSISAPSENTSTWRARLQGVLPKTAGVLLVLQPPTGFRGIVVDDTGAPVKSFRVEASPAGDMPWSNGIQRDFTSEDGAFELAGVHEGDWSVKATAEGHAAAAKVPITVPQVGPPITLRLDRAITVRGTVVDPSGTPVAGAKVEARGGDSERGFSRGDSTTTESDEDGGFRFEDLAPSGLALTASREGWAPSEAVPLIAAPGSSVADVVLTLRVGATITGEVYDAKGEPDTGALVTAGGGGFGAFGAGDLTATADSAGTFRIEHVPPGKVTVVAMPNEDALLDGLESAEGEEGMMMGFLGQMRMQSVEVADSQEVHVVLGAEPKSPVRVTGTVTEDDEPIAGASVLVIEEGGAMLQGMKVARTNDAGVFEVTVDRPGAFVFNVSREGFGDRQVPFFVDVPEGKEHRVDLALPLGVIAGRVVGPTGSPVEGIGVRLAQPGGVIRVFDFDQSRNVVTDGDGAFRFEHVEPGTYSVHAGGGSSFFAEGSKHYGAEVLDGIEVEADETVDGLEIRVSRAGRVRGTVTDGAGSPVSGVAIFVRDSSGYVLSNVSTCLTNGTGEFTYEGVPTEAVTVFAKKGDLASRETAPIEVKEGGEASVRLVVEEGSYLLVTLEDDGVPVRARLEVLDENGRQVNGMFSAASLETLVTEGFSSKESRVGPLAPGTYELRAVAADGKDTRKSVSVKAGQSERRVRLRLK